MSLFPGNVNLFSHRWRSMSFSSLSFLDGLIQEKQVSPQPVKCVCVSLKERYLLTNPDKNKLKKILEKMFLLIKQKRSQLTSQTDSTTP